jgi:hypothetical protein
VLTQQNEMLIELQRKILEIQQQQENYLQFISHEINAMKQQPKTARRRVSAEGNK